VGCADITCAISLGRAERDLALKLSKVSSGVLPLEARVSPGAPTHASGAVAFDRSPFKAEDGYRFFVSYPADLVLDTSPSVNPAAARVIR